MGTCLLAYIAMRFNNTIKYFGRYSIIVLCVHFYFTRYIFKYMANDFGLHWIYYTII